MNTKHVHKKEQMHSALDFGDGGYPQNIGTVAMEPPFYSPTLRTLFPPATQPCIKTCHRNNDGTKCAEMPNLSNSTPTESTKSVIGHENRVKVGNTPAARRPLLPVQTLSPDSLYGIPAELVSALALSIASNKDALEEFL